MVKKLKDESGKKAPSKERMVAVVRVRGYMNMRRKNADNLKMLRLRYVNNCVLVPDTPSYKGMLKKAENWITWGEISADVLKELLQKRGKEEQQERTVFHLSPPSKGYKSTKLHFPKGALGYRGEKINDLLRRMI